MNILYILGSFFPAQNGGPNNTVYWTARELVNRGVDVSVVSLKDGLLPEHLQGFNLTLGREKILDGIRTWYFDYSISRYLSLAMFRWLIVNLKQYDMVCLTSFFFPWSWFAALLCIIYSIPFSIAPRGELEPGAYRFNNKFKSLVHFLFLKRLMSKARFVLVTSEQEEIYSRSYFTQEMAFEIVPNYMDIGEEALQLEAIREKRDILYLGRIHPKKGIENLIEAFSLLDSKIIGDHRLLIVGSGDIKYLNRLNEQANASKNVGAIHFLGHQAGKEKTRIYREAKVMVLPSYSENFGNVVVEALANSTPVIASRFTPWSHLEKEGCGRWVENDPKSLVRALESILTLSQEDYICMSEAARRFVIEFYDIRQRGGELENLYTSYLR